MLPIKYKFVMDGKGLLIGVELWQGSEHITVSMAAVGTHKNGYRWIEVKEFLENVKLPEYFTYASEDKYIREAISEVHPLPRRQT